MAIRFAGENPLIQLHDESGQMCLAASLWHARWSPYGSGNSLLIWADPASGLVGDLDPTGIYTDNLPLAENLWSTFNSRWEVLGGHGLDAAAPRHARFSEVNGGEPPLHRVTCHAGVRVIDLVWHEPGEPRWVVTQPYEYDTTCVVLPCPRADVVVNGVAAQGHAVPHDDEFASSCVLAYTETWRDRE